MRKELCAALVDISTNPNMLFLTGDLGFMALEPLQAQMGERFINAGVAEQNMISVAAALAKDNWDVWCYSIAPFCFARPFEQIRNDVCLHNMPVRLIGNGGGYGYGVMGPTHHAVDDYAVLLALPNMHVYVPCFDEDVPAVIQAAQHRPGPCYIRLGRGELPNGETTPVYQPWRQLLAGDGAIIIATGPIAGMVWSTCRDLPVSQRPSVWVVSELPLTHDAFPPAVITQIARGAKLIVVEEHVSHGGLAHMLLYYCATHGIAVGEFHSMHAVGLDIGAYGSQTYLRQQSQLTPGAIRSCLGIYE